MAVPLTVSRVKRFRRVGCIVIANLIVTDGVINLDRYNMFLLGLTFQGILMLLQDFLLLHQLILRGAFLRLL